MNPESHHYLVDLFQRHPEVVPITVVFVAVFLLLMLATYLRVRPSIVWMCLSAAIFGFSQCFSSNRRDWAILAILSLGGSAVLTWVWFARVANDFVEQLEQAGPFEKKPAKDESLP